MTNKTNQNATISTKTINSTSVESDAERSYRVYKRVPLESLRSVAGSSIRSDEKEVSKAVANG